VEGIDTGGKTGFGRGDGGTMLSVYVVFERLCDRGYFWALIGRMMAKLYMTLVYSVCFLFLVSHVSIPVFYLICNTLLI